MVLALLGRGTAAKTYIIRREEGISKIIYLFFLMSIFHFFIAIPFRQTAFFFGTTFAQPQDSHFPTHKHNFAMHCVNLEINTCFPTFYHTILVFISQTIQLVSFDVYASEWIKKHKRIQPQNTSSIEDRRKHFRTQLI